MRRDPIRDKGLKYLGVHQKLNEVAYSSNGQPRSHEDRIRLLDDYKVELKKEKRRLARELHPDANCHLPQGEQDEKAELFRCVVQAVDYVLLLNVKPPAPRRPIMQGIRGLSVPGVPAGVVIIVGAPSPGFSVNTTVSGTASPTTSGTYWSGIIR